MRANPHSIPMGIELASEQVLRFGNIPAEDAEPIQRDAEYHEPVGWNPCSLSHPPCASSSIPHIVLMNFSRVSSEHILQRTRIQNQVTPA
ncbi:hypothetical protein, partial [Candidatus Magnetaquicoccus inordinatus]|uniref:hypothetical protein n=1 Tax=Candidatus Magnetaquicoccus inordinatus TaxID=2496818 RepID=UPI001D0EF8CB